MKLQPLIYCSSKFTWRGNTGYADISDLSGKMAPHGLIYDDAIDVGFTVKSARTGREVEFVHTHPEYDDGELVKEHYVSTGGNYNIILFND